MAARKQAKTAEKEVAIPSIRLKTTPVRINGTTPLLTNRFSDEPLR